MIQPPDSTPSAARLVNPDIGDPIALPARETRSQVFAPLTQPVSLNPEFERIPRTYVICTRDRIVPPALQRRLVRDREVTDVVEMDSGHHPQLSRIDELAGVLHQRARDQGPA